jgi:hypothetical protein
VTQPGIEDIDGLVQSPQFHQRLALDVAVPALNVLRHLVDLFEQREDLLFILLVKVEDRLTNKRVRGGRLRQFL